ARPFFLADPAWLRRHMEAVAPQVILVTGSAYLVTPLLRQLQRCRSQCRLFLYLAVEGEPVDEEIVRTLELADVCLFYTEHSRRSAAALCQRVAQREPGFRAPRLAVAGHGVDTSSFFPLPDRSAAKRLLFPDRLDLQKGFLVLNANRAYYRKRLDLTVEGFA